MALTKDQILSCQDIKIEEVHVPEWGGSVHIRVLSGTDREAWETAVLEKKLKGYIRTNLLVRAICDATGNPIFTDADVEVLGRKNSKVIDQLFERIQNLNKVTKQDIDALGND